MSLVGAFAIAEEGPVGTFTPGVSAIIIRWGIRGAVAWSVDPASGRCHSMSLQRSQSVPVKVLCLDGWGLRPHDR